MRTRERTAASDRLRTLQADRNATEARIVASSKELAALTSDLGVAEGELLSATKVLSDRDHDLKQLIDAGEASLGPLKQDVASLKAERTKLTAKVEALRLSLSQVIAERDALAEQAARLEHDVSAAELELKTQGAQAELAEKEYGSMTTLCARMELPIFNLLPFFPPAAAVVKAERASESKLVQVSNERRRLEVQLHEQEVRVDQSRRTSRSAHTLRLCRNPFSHLTDRPCTNCEPWS